METVYSPSWYRVAELRPSLCPEARFHRHVYRGRAWYAVQNPTTRRVHRLAPGARALAGRLDGERSVDRAWEATVAEWGDEAPTQDEALEVLGLLHGAGLLRGDVPPDTAALFRRARDEERRQRRSRLSPISFRVPLVDPDAFLSQWLPWVRPLFSRAGAALWCAVVALAAVAAVKHAPELAAAGGSLLDPTAVLALWFAYPLVKALHELGHAFAVKRWGGEVHEIGILFLVFVPVPYVDASAAAVFPDKYHRMWVGAAGIAVELFLAAACTFVWLAAEPGAIRHLAFAGMAVGGVSTLFFNGNPLLRFDGYYVLADALEISNLASKGDAYLGALGRRFLLGLRDVALPDTARGEAPWLVGYALAAFAYRMAVLLAIATYLASHFFFAGVALAVAVVAGRIALPLLRRIAYVLTDPTVGERRARALLGSVGVAAALAILTFAVPAPLRTRAEGVTWLPEESHVRAGADGFVVEVLAEPHQPVHRGEPLIRMRDAASEARLRGLEAERRERRLRVLAAERADRVQAEVARQQLEDAEASLARARERAREVWVRSPADGVFVSAGGRDPVGRYLRQGETIAYVVDLSDATARVLVTQDDVALLRERTRAAWVRLAHDPGRVLPARIAREVPAASDRLPTPALGSAGGGPFPVDPSDPDGLRTLEPVFQFELTLPPGTVRAAGERVHVRFDHGGEPLGQRAYRALRRLFLRQLSV